MSDSAKPSGQIAPGRGIEVPEGDGGAGERGPHTGSRHGALGANLDLGAWREQVCQRHPEDVGQRQELAHADLAPPRLDGRHRGPCPTQAVVAGHRSHLVLAFASAFTAGPNLLTDNCPRRLCVVCHRFTLTGMCADIHTHAEVWW